MFIAVYSYHGLIDHASVHDSLEEAKDKLRDIIEEYGFDPECDDARVFQQKPGGPSEEVYSYDPDEEDVQCS